jgi:hypothetical protein
MGTLSAGRSRRRTEYVTTPPLPSIVTPVDSLKEQYHGLTPHSYWYTQHRQTKNGRSPADRPPQEAAHGAPPTTGHENRSKT